MNQSPHNPQQHAQNSAPNATQKPAARPATPPAMDAAVLGPRLVSLIESLATVNQRLVTICEEHRTALSRADATRLADINARHAAAIAELKALDADRRKLSASAMSAFGTALMRSRGNEPTLSDLVAVLPDAQRPTLMARIDDVRSLVRSVERSTGSLKMASRQLASHMEGLLRVVATRLNHSGVYGRSGVVSAGAPVMSGLDLRT